MKISKKLVFDKKTYPHTCRAIQYANGVLDGNIPACEYIIGSCARFLDDLKNEEADFYFDVDSSERFLRLAQKFHHVKGNWATPNIVFEDWQCFIFANIYGFISRRTNQRRFRSVHIEVARGNGKSAKASIVGLYHLALENPKGNEVYSAAQGRDQARIIMDSARAMAKANKGFLKATGAEVLAHQIVHDSSNSFFRALSSDSNTLDGLQPACALIDELHAHKNRGVYDVIDSAMSKRNDSLLFSITTAGFNTTGIGYSQSVYAKKVSIGEVVDNNFFAAVFTIDKDDDPFDPEVWPKANPNWGISVDPFNFEAKANKAKNNPEDLNNFIVKHLNVWTNAMNPFFSVDRWNLCKDDTLRMEDFAGEKCWVGLDLASKVDLTSISYIFKKDKKYYLFVDNFIPEAAKRDSKNKDAYIKWSSKGELIVTPGEAINYPKLQEHVLEKAKKYSIQGIHFDPWNASELAQRLSVEGLEMIEFRMNTGNLSEPMKRLDAVIRECDLVHSGSSLMEWSLGNVVAKHDANDNVFPRKDNEQLKIDPIVASIMALAGWMQDEEKESIYESRGIVIL